MTSNINQKGWYSTKSIMNDLAQASRFRHIDNNFFVVGKTPPPRRMHNEDADMMYMYGVVPESVPDEVEKPDLNGITEMLRMVDNETIDRPRSKTDIEKPPATDNILTISKLNPEVEEFLPAASLKSVENGSQTSCEKNKRDIKALKSKVNSNEQTKNLKHCHNEHKTNGRVKDVEEMKNQLKSKISNSSNTNCVKGQRDRNLAIASLLKLCSKPPDDNNVTSNSILNTNTEKCNLEKNTGIILLPPDYYESSCNRGEAKEEIGINENRTHTREEKDCKSALSNFISSNMDSYASNSNAKDPMKNVLSVENVVKNSNVNDDDISNSVDKVKKWLATTSLDKTDISGTEPNLKPKEEIKTTQAIKIKQENNTEKSLYLGPVTFVRKNLPPSKSPTLKSEVSKKTPSSTYVPSAYASELSQIYIERAKTKESMEEDIWSRLCKELDKRDKAYRESMKEAESVST